MRCAFHGGPKEGDIITLPIDPDGVEAVATEIDGEVHVYMYLREERGLHHLVHVPRADLGV